MTRLSGLSAALLAVTLTLPIDAGRAEEQALYTWVDSDGTVHYSDKPDDPRARRLEIGTRRTDLARVKSELDAREAQRREREQQQLSSAEASEQEAREQAERRRRCERAEARLRTLSVARRPFRVDENGQQLYLTEGQIAEERAAAEQAVREYCY